MSTLERILSPCRTRWRGSLMRLRGWSLQARRSTSRWRHGLTRARWKWVVPDCSRDCWPPSRTSCWSRQLALDQEDSPSASVDLKVWRVLLSTHTTEPPPLFIWLWFLQMLTYFYNTWHTVYWVNLQHNRYSFTHLTCVLLLHYLEKHYLLYWARHGIFTYDMVKN